MKGITSIVNVLNIFRFSLGITLLVTILMNRFEVFRVLLAIGFLTDIFYGTISARWRISSLRIAAMDSAADDIIIGAALLGMMRFTTGFFAGVMPFVIGVGVLYLVELFLAFARYGNVSSFHVYSARFATVLQAIFFLMLFFIPGDYHALFLLACVATGFSLLEEIVLVLIIPVRQTGVKGLVWYLKAKRRREQQTSNAGLP